MIPSKEELIDLYRRRARYYDWTANLYYLIGYREWGYRRRAVEALELDPGDTVVEIGCGTGLNFGLLQREVASAGRVVGVDLNDAMLARARERVRRHGWSNVELVHSDAIEFSYPERVDGVLSTFAITLVPEYEEVIRRGMSALAPQGRLALVDFKRPDWPPLWLVKALAWITAPFGVSLDMADRHPWESLERYSSEFVMRDFYGGFSYLAVGSSAGDPSGSGIESRP